MNARGMLLARRRERLVRRSAHLRDATAAELRALQPALSWADRIQDAWLWLRANPLAAAAGVAALAVWRPRRVLGWGLRAWSAWKLVQRVRAPGPAPGRRP
jgi:YqjK-like protein